MVGILLVFVYDDLFFSSGGEKGRKEGELLLENFWTFFLSFFFSLALLVSLLFVGFGVDRNNNICVYHKREKERGRGKGEQFLCGKKKRKKKKMKRRKKKEKRKKR